MSRHSRCSVITILFALLTLGSAPVWSQQQDQGFYAGFNFGKSKVKDVCIPGLTTCDDTDTAISIFGGYQFNKNFGAEIAYTDLGKANFAGPGGSVSVESTGLEFSVVGMIPLTPQFSLYGKFGFYMWDAKVRGVVNLSDDGTDPTFGFGVRWSFAKNLALQAQWQRYDVSDADIDVIGVGLLFKF